MAENCIARRASTGRAKKVIPQEKFDISGIVADFFTKFTAFKDEDTGHISCKSYYNNTCGSVDTTV